MNSLDSVILYSLSTSIRKTRLLLGQTAEEGGFLMLGKQNDRAAAQSTKALRGGAVLSQDWED